VLTDRNSPDPLIDFSITLSIGVAHWNPGDDTSIESVLSLADEEMYADKRRQTLSPGPEEP
jgi:GGDEF domain-containing protein